MEPRFNTHEKTKFYRNNIKKPLYQPDILVKGDISTNITDVLELKDLSGGGIIPYNEKGIWLVSETRGTKKLLSDAGGRYRFEDIDIYGCISREWNEETYFTSEIRRKDVLELINKKRTKYSLVRGQDKKIVYVVYFFHIDDLKDLSINVPSNEEFTLSRNNAISRNEKNRTQYTTLNINYYLNEDIMGMDHNGRLNHIFRNIHKLGNNENKII